MEPLSIEELVGRNIAERRRALGLTQDELARRLAAVGVPMAQNKLSRIEAGQRGIPLGELVMFCAAFDTSVAQLADGKVEVEILPDVIASAAAVRRALSGQGGYLRRELAGGTHATHGDRQPATQTGVGEAERYAARRLGVTVKELVAAARSLWGGMTLTEKRDAVVVPETYAGSPSEDLRTARRQQTRTLMIELAEKLGVDPRKAE